MTVGGVEGVRRLARLSRLEVAESDLAGVAQMCERIASDFSALSVFASGLPEAPDAPSGSLREDVVAPAEEVEVEGILAAFPRVDAASREVLAPRGHP